MSSFVIVTVDGTTYRQGQPADQIAVLKEIGATGTLDRFQEDGDYVDLLFTNGSKLSIPEHRINCIATHA